MNAPVPHFGPLQEASEAELFDEIGRRMTANPLGGLLVCFTQELPGNRAQERSNVKFWGSRVIARGLALDTIDHLRIPSIYDKSSE